MDEAFEGDTYPGISVAADVRGQTSSAPKRPGHRKALGGGEQRATDGDGRFTGLDGAPCDEYAAALAASWRLRPRKPFPLSFDSG